MITLFEGYVAGLIAGMLGSLRNPRYWAFSFFYSIVIVTAHLMLVGSPDYPMAKLWGEYFYVGAGGAQLIIMLAALALWSSPSAIIALLAYGAVVVNALCFADYPSHDGIWQYQYALINTIQVLQIASLIVLSPASIYLFRLIIARFTMRKELKWQSRSQI